MTNKTDAKEISKRHYQRIVEIVSDPHNEFNDVCEKMGAMHGRMLIFMEQIDELE